MIRQLIEEVVKSLVSNQNNVTIDKIEQPDGIILFTIKVAKEDLGKVIGRKGQTIRAIREMARALSEPGKTINIEITA